MATTDAARLRRMATYPNLWPWEVAELRAAGITPEYRTDDGGPVGDLPDDGPRPHREPDMSPEAQAERAEAKRRMADALAYVAAYRGSWGLPLDIRADRRFGTAYMTLTPRQVDALLAGRDRDAARAAAAAANVIDADEWEADEYAAWAASRPAGTPAAPAGERPQAGQVWRTASGQVVRVVRARQTGNLYGKVWEGGAWEYARGILPSLVARLTLEEAEAFGRETGQCCVCGALLTDPVSIARGIGPVCAGRL